jgi:hypothetical protein
MGRTEQLSLQRLARPEETAEELCRILDKYEANTVDKGLASARLLAANLRNWRIRGSLSCLKRLARKLNAAAIVVLAASASFFYGHMLYRLTYRCFMGRAWR